MSFSAPQRVYVQIVTLYDPLCPWKVKEYTEFPATVERSQTHPARGEEVIVTLDFNPSGGARNDWAFPLARVRHLKGPPRIIAVCESSPVS